MLLLRITGSQLKAARAFANLSIGEVSRRADLNRASIRKWESSSDTVPSANLAHLSRMIDVLENAGIEFGLNSVRRQQRPAATSTTLVSEARP